VESLAFVAEEKGVGDRQTANMAWAGLYGQ
jgi:hypothetical protein